MSLKDLKSSNRPSKTQESRALACRDDGPDQRPAARLKRALGEVMKLLRQADLPALLAKFRKTPPVTVPEWGSLSHANIRLRGWFKRLQALRSRPYGWPEASFDFYAPRLHSKPR